MNSAIASLLLMFIGGSPVGTAGGIKTVTFAVIPPDNVTDTAENDQQNGHEIDNGVMDIGVQAVFRYHVHTSIAESGDGVKQGNPDTFYAKFGDKHRHIQKRADSFDQKRSGTI